LDLLGCFGLQNYVNFEPLFACCEVGFLNSCASISGLNKASVSQIYLVWPARGSAVGGFVGRYIPHIIGVAFGLYESLYSMCKS
jgi:hypothetical protein